MSDEKAAITDSGASGPRVPGIAISKKTSFAIIGASADKAKFGHIVAKDLLTKGYEVFLVNPKGGRILDHDVYPRLRDLPKKPDIAVFVVPPQVTATLLHDVGILGIKTAWMQPGSENDQARRYCEENHIGCSFHRCIMLETDCIKVDRSIN